MFTALIYGLATSVLVGLPADIARRRIPKLAPFASLATVAGMVAAAAAAKPLGVLQGDAAVAALVFGLISGSMLADTGASHFLGAPRSQN